MKRALILAQRGLYTTDPNPRVGCVIVKNDKVIGQGWHQQAGGPHAEIAALNDSTDSPQGSSVYVTLEPCAFTGRTGACTVALIAAGVKEVIFAHEDPNPKVSGKGCLELEQAGIHVRHGLMATQARQLNRGFIKRMTTGLPFVRLKLAISLDGATALANGQSQWITGPEARDDGHKFRAQSSAIVTGIGTVLADNPRMTARLASGVPVLQPMPVILDSSARLPMNANIGSRPCVVFVARGAATKAQNHVEFIEIDQCSTDTASSEVGLDLNQVLTQLGQKEMNDILVEAGPKLSSAFFCAGLVDELVVYQAPVLLGTRAKRMLDLGPFDSMDEAYRLRVRERVELGEAMRLILEPKCSEAI